MCFSPSWRLGSPRPRGRQVRCPAGTRLLVRRRHLSAVPSRGRATGSELCVSSCEGTNPIHGGSILMPGSPPKPAPPNTIPPGGRAQHVTRGDQTLSPWHPHLGECGQLDKGNGQWLVGFATGHLPPPGGPRCQFSRGTAGYGPRGRCVARCRCRGPAWYRPRHACVCLSLGYLVGGLSLFRGRPWGRFPGGWSGCWSRLDRRLCIPSMCRCICDITAVH